MSAGFPLARSEWCITEELGGQLLVYDTESNLAHALDGDAIKVWRACDGRSDLATLAARCATDEEHVSAILARLLELGLLAVSEDDESGDTRRSALRKLTIGGVGLGMGIPAITSILVPTAAHAQSCMPTGTCTTIGGGNCCSGQQSLDSSCPGGARCSCVASGQCTALLSACCSGNVVFDPACLPGVGRCQ